MGKLPTSVSFTRRSEKNWRCHGNDRTTMANPIFSTISVEYSWGRWQPEMKKNSKLGHERGSKKGVENTTRNCGKRDQLRVVCHHLFSVTFRSPSKLYKISKSLIWILAPKHFSVLLFRLHELGLGLWIPTKLTILTSSWATELR